MKDAKTPAIRPARIPWAVTILILLFSLIGGKASATTWDEPWADKVIAGSSSFILAKVVSSDRAKGINIEVTRTLAGETLKGHLLINGFYLLHLCSASGEGPEFDVPPADSCYFFLYRNEKGQYCIATPTTGYASIYQGNVAATYRHSYHQAAVPPDVYERTMTAIFNNYHYLPYDQAYIQGFVKEHLGQKPAPLTEAGAPEFFLQHVALECVHHLRLSVDESLIYPFLNDTANFHNQVSAARALVAFNTARSKAALIGIIGDTSRGNFVKVMCIWTLQEFHPADLKSTLQAMQQTASTADAGFGGNIMDPRVCTNIPTVKDALGELIAKL